VLAFAPDHGLGRMELPVLPQTAHIPALAPDPDMSQQRDVLAQARRAQQPKRRPSHPQHQRRPSLRRVKDSREQLRTTRARGASTATADSTLSSSQAGRSFTVANINNGIIYLRYVVKHA